MRHESITRTYGGWRIEGGKEARATLQRLVNIVESLLSREEMMRIFPLKRVQRIADVRRELHFTAVEYLERVKRETGIAAAERLNTAENLLAFCTLDWWSALDDPMHSDHCRTINVSTRWHDRMRYLLARDARLDPQRVRANHSGEYEANRYHTVFHHLCRAGMTVAEYHARKALFATPTTEATPVGRGWTINHWINIRAGNGALCQTLPGSGRGNRASRRMFGRPSRAELRRKQTVAHAHWKQERYANLLITMECEQKNALGHLLDKLAVIE